MLGLGDVLADVVSLEADVVVCALWLGAGVDEPLHAASPKVAANAVAETKLILIFGVMDFFLVQQVDAYTAFG